MLGAPQAATYPRPPASRTGSGLTRTLWDPGGSAGVTQLRRPPSPIWPAGSLQGLTGGSGGARAQSPGPLALGLARWVCPADSLVGLGLVRPEPWGTQEPVDAGPGLCRPCI